MSDILLSGKSGLVGGALAAALEARGDRVWSLVRKASSGERELRWDPMAESLESCGLDVGALPKLDAIVHLAGEPVGAGRWSSEGKRRILESRTRSTALLASLAASRGIPTFVTASGVGFYGTRADQWVDESSPQGDGFLAEVVAAWEGAQGPARAAGVRCVAMRLGVVLARDGGALAKMLPVFRLGAGGPIGGGGQWMSYLSLSDAVRAFCFALDRRELEGPVNVATPNPVTNGDFTRSLGKALGRPAIIPLPMFAVSAAFGEMGRETILASQRVSPKKLAALGFEFEHPTIDHALASAIRG
jgi:uncharacterized protein (TIGR01777 family)